MKTKKQYQQALDELKNVYEFEDCCQNPYEPPIGETYKKQFDTLQELIDNLKE